MADIFMTSVCMNNQGGKLKVCMSAMSYMQINSYEKQKTAYQSGLLNDKYQEV